MSRHKELSKQVSQNLTVGTSIITETAISDRLKKVTDYFTAHYFMDIFKDGSRIFKVVETAFSLGPKDKQILVRKGSKTVYNSVANDEKECLTVLVNIAANVAIPPPLI